MTRTQKYIRLYPGFAGAVLASIASVGRQAEEV
jgi:hypothetical protein